ncbi:MAG: methyl-accepting chemotaxis protein, partial [Marinobacter sp.]|nr:methyl-accepting chemotaxis protein [Marinobacter sp.]
MTVRLFESTERRLGVSGKLLIAPVFILLLFALVTFYSVQEFKNLDGRLGTVATDLAPETAVATGVVVNLYQLRLKLFDYYATGDEETLSEFQRLESEFFAELENARVSIDAEGRLHLVNQIEQATREFVRIFKEELVPAKQQVLRLVAEELDEYGPE